MYVCGGVVVAWLMNKAWICNFFFSYAVNGLSFFKTETWECSRDKKCQIICPVSCGLVPLVNI